MSNESHLEKIKKLLRLSKSSNRHEAELAMQRAMELGLKHQVDVAALAHNDPELAHLESRFVKAPARLSREWRFALWIAGLHFQVSVCVYAHRKSVLVVGAPDAVDVAEYIMHFLVRECRRQCGIYLANEKAAKRRASSGKRAAYITGFFAGINSRLQEGAFDLMRQNPTWALVLSSDKARRDAELERLTGAMKTMRKLKPARRSGATVAGYISGRNTQAQRPLNGPANSRALEQGQLLLS